jgi:hypothetical protein
MRLDVYGPNLHAGTTPHGETFAVHAAGCAHGKRGDLRTAPADRDHEFASRAALCDTIYPPSDFDCESGEYVSEFYIAPCARSLPYRSEV